MESYRGLQLYQTIRGLACCDLWEQHPPSTPWKCLSLRAILSNVAQLHSQHHSIAMKWSTGDRVAVGLSCTNPLLLAKDMETRGIERATSFVPVVASLHPKLLAHRDFKHLQCKTLQTCVLKTNANSRTCKTPLPHRLRRGAHIGDAVAYIKLLIALSQFWQSCCIRDAHSALPGLRPLHLLELTG